MITYITAFIFYTLAMVGILMTGFIIYKKTFISSKSENKGIIKVIDSYMIAPKKTLLIVKIKNEKFLIASDATVTTFLAKLSDDMIDDSVDSCSKEEAIQKILKEVNAQEEAESYRQKYTAQNIKYENQDEAKKMQSNFMDLYKNSGISNSEALKKVSSKKEIIQKLLSELNETKTQSGRKY